MVRVGMVGFAGVLASTLVANAQSPVERGRYLVDTVMTCQNCHTPMGPNGPQFDKALSGGLRFDEPPFDVTASNITPDQETGIGRWSDAELKKAIQFGVRPNGVRLAEMPMPEADLNDKVKRGFYLVTIAHCLECHTPFGAPGTGVDFQDSLGKGGREFHGPWGVSVSRNITSSKTNGIGDWSDADIKRAITQGVRKDGSKLKPPMGYPYYAKMTDGDVDAMVAYLRALPAKE
jgi:mono/diheme cytochrome c family protein